MQRWQGLVGREVVTDEGRRLKVIYPGRTNRDVGPDFRNAVIAMGESEIVRGDVEIHIKSSDWYSHGHHHDPEYDHVILHVVLWHNCKSPTLVQNGRSVPIANLSEAGACRQGAHQIPRGYGDRREFAFETSLASGNSRPVALSMVAQGAFCSK